MKNEHVHVIKKQNEITEYLPTQLELFCDVPEDLSNTIEIFDAIPKWEWRTRKTSIVETSTREFKLKNKVTGEEIPYKAEIIPAVLGRENEKKYAYFPGCKEEIVESALRKLFIDKKSNFFEEKYKIDTTQKVVDRFGFVVTIAELKRELMRTGHEYNYKQIMQALEILAGTRINIRKETEEGSLDCSGETIISFVRHKKKNDIIGDQTYLSVSFHSLVRGAIQKELFHSYPYAIEMGLKNQIDRWFLRRFYHNFRNASHQKSIYRISLINTIVPEANLKDHAIRRAMLLVDDSLSRLEENGIISKSFVDERFKMKSYQKDVILTKVDNKGKGRPKIEDVLYHINLSYKTIEEIIKDNIRKSKMTTKIVGDYRSCLK